MTLFLFHSLTGFSRFIGSVSWQNLALSTCTRTHRAVILLMKYLISTGLVTRYICLFSYVYNLLIPIKLIGSDNAGIGKHHHHQTILYWTCFPFTVCFTSWWTALCMLQHHKNMTSSLVPNVCWKYQYHIVVIGSGVHQHSPCQSEILFVCYSVRQFISAPQLSSLHAQSWASAYLVPMPLEEPGQSIHPSQLPTKVRVTTQHNFHLLLTSHSKWQVWDMLFSRIKASPSSGGHGVR